MAAARDQLKIFVGGLAQHSTKQTLDQYFSQFGFADSFVMQDKATGRSRGFGFVNFRDPTVMEAVLQASHEVDGCPITVSPYAGNFNPRGGVARAAPSAAAMGTAAGMAGGGIDATGGMDATATLLSQVQQQLQVAAAAAGCGSGGGGGGAETMQASSSSNLKIFVGGLAQHTTKESLNTYFSQFGHADSYVMMDKTTGRSRGFGFLNFSEERSVNMCLQYSHEVDGTIITVSPYENSSGAKGGGSGGGNGMAGGGSEAEMMSNTVAYTLGLLQKLQSQLMAGQNLGGVGMAQTTPNKLFVGGLTPSTTSEMLQEAFAAYGPVSCEVMKDKETGNSRGFGFVTLTAPEFAQAAMQAQHIVDGAQVEVSECWEKGTSKRMRPY